ncbi:hypothetical protein QYM36_001367 [Artemia franciscana]|uniref:Protein wntless n=1 Tax=Artemia franciscana TaxID=6661 RepID=A0AA88ICY1_ARTSF|nr:hypothetical protein QYM36_001367 [Artemia franciscana]
MSGAIVENLSGRKLAVLTGFLLACLISCFLLGGLVAPAPSNVQVALGVKCLDPTFNKSGWFYSRGKGACQSIEDFTDPLVLQRSLTANNIVFSFQLPLPREGVSLDYSRWMQNLIGVLQVDIAYRSDDEMGVSSGLNKTGIEQRPTMTIEAKLGYSNQGDAAGDWKFYAGSTEQRILDCTIDQKIEDYYYKCDLLPLFELGSLHHDFYLLNLRLPVYEDRDTNKNLGAIKDLWLVAINQNGGFTKVWISLKTFFFPLSVGVTVWYWRRVLMLSRESALLERMLLAVGIALSFLNLPLEYFTLAFDMPYMLLIGDIRQGIFYVILLSFWLVFAGEHLMIQDDPDRNRLWKYRKHLSSVGVGCLCMFLFDMCERGVQLSNPFYSIWSKESEAKIALAFVIIAGVCAGLYFVFLCYMVFRVFRNIGAKRNALPTMSMARRLFYEGVMYRFKVLMLATIVCSGMTIAGFILGQVSEGKWKWDENIELEYTSAFFTGVYGMCNVYIIALLCLYAPSHKRWPSESGTDGFTGEEIEFSPLPTEPSELSTLTDLVRKTATD